ncbi:MAG: hypothetical protein DHS20C18_49910 [Saprospiraceae bacterium]|nr:MAG: hypothetical protein DHS20C18_49910 [Saprospiraceae bacterium]
MNEFDRTIREKMKNLNPEYAPETWDLLEQKLDATEAGPAVVTDEEAIDELAFTKLHQFEADYEPEHWQTFSRRLDEESATSREVLRYKLIEFSLMLLLLLTLWQYLPFDQNKSVPKLEEGLPNLPLEAPAEQAQTEKAEFEASSIAINTPNNSRLDENGADQFNTADQPIATAGISKVDNQVDPADFSTDQATSSDKTSSSKEIPDFLPALSKYNVQALNIYTDRVAGLINTPINQLQERSLVIEWNTETLLANLEALQLEPLSPSLTEQSLELFPMAHKQKFNIRIGMQGSTNYDRIITPPTEVDEDSIVSLDRYALGYTGGLSLGFEKGRWEIETGFFYSAKRYQPLSVLYVTGSVKRGLYGEAAKDFEFNTVYFPLQLRYNYLQKNTWRLFVSGGGSMHTVVQANYYLSDQDGFRNALFAPAPVPRGEPERPEQVEEYDLVKGLFEGGGLLENSYFSANVGLGVEKYLTGRLSIFGQANYAHSFYYPSGGIGPFLDRFHTTSLLMGIKVTVSD